MTQLVSATRISIQNILFATDFSSCSETALRHALAFSRRHGSTLYTVSVFRAGISNDEPRDPYYFRRCAEKKMANLVKSGLFQGIKHRELITEEQWSVSDVLLGLIAKFDIHLIVLGTRGRGGIKKVVTGSVAEEIVNCAPCAVLTVGPHVSPESVSESKLQRVLYATDLLPGSARALAHALWLVERERAQLTLLHVLKRRANVPSGYLEAERDNAMKRLMQVLPPDTAASVETEFIVQIGAPAEQILKVAEDQRADLVVMGPHHTAHPLVSAHIPWVTPHQILCHVGCPVLTARG